MSKSTTSPKKRSETARRVPEALQRPHDCFEAEILRRVWDRLNRRNEHFMCAIVGREGSGKSHTAIRLASEIDPTFSHDRVIFDVAELLRILKDGEHEPGNAYVLDEAGVSLGVRTWQERGQILANQAMQLIRDHNLALIFTLPRLGELDSQTQGRLQAFYEITRKEPDVRVIGKWKYMKPDRSDHSGNILKPFPKIRRNGVVHEVRRLSFSPPDPALVEPYQDRKREYQNEFYEQVIDELEDDDTDDSGGKDPKEVVDQVKEDGIGRFVSIHGGNKQPYIDGDMIQMEYDLSVRDTKKVKKLLERDEEVSLTEHTQG